MHLLFDNLARGHTRLSKQDHQTVIERGRGIEFHLQDVEFDDDEIPGEVEFPAHRSPPFLSLDGKTVFTVLSCRSRAGRMEPTVHYFIVHHSLTDGQAHKCRCFTEDQPQGSYFRIAGFDDIHRLHYMHFYALSGDRLGAMMIDKSHWIVNQYVIQVGHRPRLAEVTVRRFLPIRSSRFYSSRLNLQLDGRIMLPSEFDSIYILAADIETPESDKYCHCCRLNGYFSRLEIEAQNHNVLPPSLETLTLGRNGVYVGTKPFCVLGLEWQRNNELPEHLCHRRAEDTVPVFYRFDQQFVNIHDDDWFLESVDVGKLVRQTPKLPEFQKRTTLDVFILDLTRLVPAHESFRNDHLNLVPGTPSVVVRLGNLSSVLRLQSTFDVPPLRQLVFEAIYKRMKPEERSRPGWMGNICGFECA